MSVDETNSPPTTTQDPDSVTSEPTKIYGTGNEQVTQIIQVPADPPSVIVPDPPASATPVSTEELEAMRLQFHADLETLRTQIQVLQARASALEAQIAKIEPLVEARLSRTEVLVLKLQGEISGLTKAIGAKDTTEKQTLSALADIKGMLQTLVATKPSV